MIFEEQINVQLKRLCLDIAKPKVEAVVFVILPGKYFLTLGPLWLAVFSVLEISRVNCFYIQSNSVVQKNLLSVFKTDSFFFISIIKIKKFWPDLQPENVKLKLCILMVIVSACPRILPRVGRAKKTDTLLKLYYSSSVCLYCSSFVSSAFCNTRFTCQSIENFCHHFWPGLNGN